MSTITLPNRRVGSDLTVRLKLKDGGLAIDWSTLSRIKAFLYSDAQRAMAGRCDVSVDGDDPTILVCRYASTKMQYLGVNRIIVQCSYLGETKTYDKPALNFVRWTSDQEGEELTIDDPDIDVEIDVEDVTSAILQNILDACIQATEEAREVVDTSRGPRGYSAYEIAVQDGFEGTEEEWLESLQGETGPQGPEGPQGETGPAGVTDVEVDVSPSSGTPAGTGSVYDGTLSLHFTGLKGQSAYEVAVENGFEGTEEEWLASLVGPQGQQGVKGDTGAKGDKGDTGETGPQGLQGNTGASQDYPFELVNNETTDDATKAHSAAGAKRLKDEISQLEAEVHNLSGKYYGLFETSADLPEGDATGYAFVGASEPFSIWNFDGEDWADSGATVTGITGEPGVGFESVASPTQADGTAIITLSNGDTITLDLNHNHPAYYSKVLGGAQPVGGFLPDVVYSLGTLSGTITFSLASPVTGNVNHYFWMFDTGVSAPTITWPAGLTWADGSAPTVAASKHYEVSIMDGIAAYLEV